MHIRQFVNGRWVNTFFYNAAELKERLKDEKVKDCDNRLFQKAMELHPKSCSMAAQYIKQNRWAY